VAGHDPVDLGRLIGLADREERLDAALGADGLDPHVVAPVQEREREGGGLRARDAELLPHALMAERRRS
jgi:hypothetical protein